MKKRLHEKQLIISSLKSLGIKRTKDGKDLDSLDYYALRRLLAIERAVRS